MRKIITCLIILCCMGCGKQTKEFSGNSIRNEREFSLDFQVLNGEETSMMNLQKGDEIRISTIIEEGSVNLLVKNDKGTTAYQGTEVENSTFTVKISEEGIYTITVTGEDAKGSCSFVMEEGRQ